MAVVNYQGGAVVVQKVMDNLVPPAGVKVALGLRVKIVKRWGAKATGIYGVVADATVGRNHLKWWRKSPEFQHFSGIMLTHQSYVRGQSEVRRG